VSLGDLRAGEGLTSQQRPAAGELVELGQLLGQQEWVAAEGDEVGAEEQPAGAAGGQHQPEQRVEHRGRTEGPTAAARRTRLFRGPSDAFA
jgi:hypothetical protein